MADKEQYCEQLPYWKDLSSSEQDRIRQCAVIQCYPKGQIIQSCDSECLGMVLVIKGMIRTYILSEEGREITLFRLHEGEPSILSASCVISQITFDTHMVAEQDTELLIISSSVFGQLSQQNIYVRCFMFELATERFSTVMSVMQDVLFKRFDQRLAAFLVREYDRTGLSEIRMTHEQIARQTSSAREVVARTLKRFVSDGLVDVKRGSIKLTNIPELRKLN